MPKLKQIVILQVHLKKELVDALANLENPPRISLSVGGADDDDLDRLKKLSFESLWIESDKITDAGLSHLDEYSEINDLALLRTQMTDEGLKHIGRFTHLKSLDLTGNGITDAGLNNFDDFDQLTTLVLIQTKVTPEGIEEFKRKHPNTKVFP